MLQWQPFVAFFCYMFMRGSLVHYFQVGNYSHTQYFNFICFNSKRCVDLILRDFILDLARPIIFPSMIFTLYFEYWNYC